jgi:hypothetical protein
LKLDIELQNWHFQGADLFAVVEKATSSHAMNGECGMDLAQSET